MPVEKNPLNVNNFKPGTLTRDGFLGRDARPIPEVVQQDADALARCRVTSGETADFLQSLIDAAKKGLEGPVVHGGRVIQIHWARGMLPCPFGESRLHPKIFAAVTDPSTGRTFRFSQLSVHLIREHGFFGGTGSPYRVEPEEIIALMQQPFIHRKEEYPS